MLTHGIDINISRLKSTKILEKIKGEVKLDDLSNKIYRENKEVVWNATIAIQKPDTRMIFEKWNSKNILE